MQACFNAIAETDALILLLEDGTSTRWGEYIESISPRISEMFCYKR